jgi:hypothetical protein
MKRHAFDPFSFIFGVAFLVLAGGLSMNAIDIQGGGLRWIGAGLLLLLGLVLLLTSARSTADRQ